MAERLLRLLFGGALILTIGTSLRRAVPVGRRLLQQSRSYPGVHICRAFRATTTSSVLSMTPVIAPGCTARGSATGPTGTVSPAVRQAGVGTLVDTARHGEIRGPGPD
jgi:hypothetical protein